ncbi:MAG TPA: carboxypeptidase-like regulatory domain-containing protein [Solirubrobacteraceae bacterium]|jgi:hypothetical protein
MNPLHPASRSTHAHRRLLLALLTLAMTLVPGAAHAADGTFTQILCANPDTGRGLGVSSVDGLTTPSSAPAWRATVSLDACGTGPVTSANAITLGPATSSSVPYNGYAAIHYAVLDPALRIERGRYFRSFSSGQYPFEVSTRIVQHGGGDPTEAEAPTNGWDSFWTGRGATAGRSDQPFAHENEVQPQHDGRSFSVTAQCRDTGASCSHGAAEWSYRFFGGKVTLYDDEAPVIDELSGSLLDGGSLTTESLTFRVSDDGSGIYRFKLYIDGEETDVRDLTAGADAESTDRDDTCFDANPQNSDPYEFARQQPCPAALDRTIDIDTGTIPDGRHQLRAVVEDAGGNEVALVDRDVTVDNHPAPGLLEPTLPQIDGEPVVGAALRGTNGSWRDAAKYDFYWQRCPTENSCVVLADYPGRAYVPTAEDVGTRLRFLVVATNDVGEWTTATSPYSAPIEAAHSTTPAEPSTGLPPGQPGSLPDDADAPPAHGAAVPPAPAPNGRGATASARLVLLGAARKKLRSRFNAKTPLAGRLTGDAGRPIAGAIVQVTVRNSAAGASVAPLTTAITGEDGTFHFIVPPGPSRRIDISYSPSLTDVRPAAVATVRLVVPASLSLRVRPAPPGRTTRLTGALRFLPRAGIQIEVQALDGRRWRTFDTTRTRRGGVFRYGYRFKAPAAGRVFHLRALVASPIYPFARGASAAVRVRVPR